MTASLADDRLVATIDLPGATPAAVVAGFCEPDRLRQWWGGELTCQLRPGGAYVVEFPQLGQTMRGEVRSYAPAGPFSFRWAWDHEPDAPPLAVTVRVDPIAGGARLVLEHGPYVPANRAEAAGHQEGWEFFLPRLATCLSR